MASLRRAGKRKAKEEEKNARRRVFVSAEAINAKRKRAVPENIMQYMSITGRK